MAETATIQFVEHALPALEPGKYRIDVDQHMVFPGDEPAKTFSYNQFFHVLGPRFGLGAADVQSVYPPANSQGQFEQTLPHIVLRRRTLPWERRLGGTNGAGSVPWFGLLLFHEGELQAGTQLRGLGEVLAPGAAGDKIKRPSLSLDEIENLDVPAAAESIQGNQTGPFQINAGQNDTLVLCRDGGAPVEIVLPNKGSRNIEQVVTDLASNASFTAIATAANNSGKLTISASSAGKLKLLNGNANATLGLLATQTRTIDVPKALFFQIAPKLGELPLLTHVRHVSTDNKEPQGMLEDGWFAVVLCNRLSLAGLNSVHLVSLEGWGDALANPSSLEGFDTMRLISLASWSFSQLPARGSFKELMQHLDVGLLQVAIPPGLAPATAPEAQLLKGALNSGYVPLAYNMRQGEHTAAWYRGPLLPVAVTSQDRDPFPSAEAGMIYDARTGMLDVSYAVAWQIGRLLALADIKFSDALTEWRQDGNAVLDQLLSNEQRQSEFELSQLLITAGQIAKAPDDQKQKLALQLLQDLLTPGHFSRRLCQLVLDQFEAGLSLQRALIGTKRWPFTVVAGQSDSFRVQVLDQTVTVILALPGVRTTDQIIASLNGDAAFSKVAQAMRANDIDGAIAVSSLDPAAQIRVLDGTANTVLGFASGAQSPARAIIGTAQGPYTIAIGGNDKFSVTVGATAITSTLTAGVARTAADVAADLNGDPAFRAVARALAAGNGNRQVAVLPADPTAALRIGTGSANTILGFIAGAQLGAPAPAVLNGTPDTKRRLLGSTSALIDALNTADISGNGFAAALAIRRQILTAG